MSRPVHACVVLVTVPVLADAERIVAVLIGERLAACGNIIPGLTSLYSWQGAMERSAEVLVLLKTTQARLTALTERVVELHPYDLPEVLALPALGGLAAYLQWVEDSTSLVTEEEEAE